jgi:hypothetical protein
MGLRQTCGNLLEVTQELSQVGLVSMDLLAQRLAINKLHRNEVDIASTG